ncbi:MAG: hypothetical protein WCO35_01430 [Candidatus Nomurabacteria bacterium]
MHILVGLLMFVIPYFLVKNLFYSKSKNYRLSLIVTFWLCVVAVALVDWFFIPNWLLALKIQIITTFIFGVPYGWLNRNSNN